MRTKSGQKGVILVAVGWLAVAPYVVAQDVTPPATDKAPSPSKTEDDKDKGAVKVTVKGHKKPVKPADRDVYDVSQDPTTKTGTVADTLKKIPGIVIDPVGHLTLHGKPATLLVDGRPSLLLSGDNQAAALKAMPSSFISSVEVITSPGAQYASDGAGGIINLVSNHHMPIGGMASIMARASSTGGYDLNAFGSYHAGKLTVHGFATEIHGFDRSKSGSSLAEVAPDGDVTQITRTAGTSREPRSSLIVSGELQYEPTRDDILGVKVQVMDAHNGMRDASHTDSSGATTNVYDSTSLNISGNSTNGATFDWMHYGKKPNETLSVSAGFSRNSSTSWGQTIDNYIQSSVTGNIGDRATMFQNLDRNDSAVFTADYAGPVWDDQMHLGIEIHSNDDRSEELRHFPEPLTAVAGIVPLADSRFTYRQTLSAAYITYQKELGEQWTVLGGLRAETLDLDTDFLSLQSTGHLVYTRLNPSLFATYVISPKAYLRLNYTRRLQRPQPRDLNPYVILSSATTVMAGNPNLKPQDTDIYEARYAYTDRMLNLTLRAFYNRDQHLIATSSHFIPDPQNLGNQVLETTQSNFGFQDQAGVETTYSNQFWQKLFVMLNTTLQTTRLRSPDVLGPRSGTSLGGMVMLNFDLSPKTGLSFNYNTMGRQLTGQGHYNFGASSTLSLSHALTPALNLIASVNDPFRTGKSVSVTNTENMHGTFVNSHTAPTFMITLSRSFSHYAVPK